MDSKTNNRLLGRRPTREKKAAALRYDVERDQVPRVVAKGRNKVAEKIIDAAQKNGVTIHEDPDLVELLTKLDIGDLIPAKLYVAVAEVMAYVYRINNRADEVRQMLP